MSTLVINEFEDCPLDSDICFTLETHSIKNCTGCFSCWWKTPGRCIYTDLNDFYRAYVNSDEVIFTAKLENGFVSSRLKALFDRMIPLFMPYTTYRGGGTYHVPRYPSYPNVRFYYEYDFESQEDFEIFYAYISKVFDQFYAKDIKILPLAELKKEAAL